MNNKITKSTRSRKTIEELRAASDVLEYEIRMLNDVADAIHNFPKGIIHSALHDALIESFVVHTRILIELFYPPETIRYPTEKNFKIANDTIIAADFFLNESQWKMGIPVWLKEIREKANKLLAHLTYSRMFKYENDKGWDYLKIKGHLNEIFAKFRKEVPQDRIGEKLRKYKVLSKSIG